MFRLNTLRYLFVLIFQSANAENMRNVTKMDSANARKATSRNKGNAYRLKVCVSLITVELLRTATFLQGPHFWGTVHNWHLFPPLYNGHFFTAATLISSIPKVVKESFNCNCNITSENTVRLLYSLFCFLKRLHFTSFSHPSHKNHQGSFHLSPSLANINFFPSAFQDQEWRLLHQAFRSRDPSDKCPARRSGLNCMNLAFATTFIFDVLWTRLKFFSLVSWPFFDFPDLYNTHVHSLIKCIDSVWTCCYFRKGKVRCNPFLKTALDFLFLFYPKKGKLCRL